MGNIKRKILTMLVIALAALFTLPVVSMAASNVLYFSTTNEVNAKSFMFKGNANTTVGRVICYNVQGNAVYVSSETIYANKWYNFVETKKVKFLQINDYTSLSSVYVNTGDNGTGNTTTADTVSSSKPEIIIPPVIPNAPTGLTGTAGDKQVNLSWDAVADAAIYKIYIDGVHKTSVTGITANIAGLINGTEYSFKVTAGNMLGDSLPSDTVKLTPKAPPPPNAPTGLTGAAEDKQVNLSWNAVAAATNYKIYVDGVHKLTVSTNSANIIGLINGTQYSFTVTAVNSNGESVPSNAVKLTPKAPPPPNAPTGLTGTAEDKQVNLSWNAVAAALSYNIYVDGVYKQTVSTSRTNITGLINGTEYSFTVTTVNEIGESAPSNAVKLTPKAPPPPNSPVLQGKVVNGQAVLNWTRNSETDLAGYNLYQDGAKIGTYTTNTATVTGLTNGKSYAFEVTAYDLSGKESAKSNKVSIKIELETIPTVKASPGNKKVTLSWDAVPNATAYKVYRDEALLATVNQTTYTDENLVNGKTYAYRAAAIIAGVTGTPSAPAKATPGDFIEFPGSEGGGMGPVTEVIQTAFNFLAHYWIYITVVLGILFAPVIIRIPVWLVNLIRPKKQPKGKQREPLSPEEKERRAKERRLNRARDDKYAYLTRLGRVAERERWVKQTNYLNREQRIRKAMDERNQKAREQRAATKKSGSSSRTQRTAAKKSSSSGRSQRTSRGGRKQRNGR